MGMHKDQTTSFSLLHLAHSAARMLEFFFLNDMRKPSFYLTLLV